MYWETYLSDQTKTQTVISLKTWGQDEFFDKKRYILHEIMTKT